MIAIALPCPYCHRCQVRLAVSADGVVVRPDPPPHGRCAHLVYLEGECADDQKPRGAWFCWYHPAFTAADPQGELRGGILTGMVNLYPCREVFRPAEPFEVAVATNGHGHATYACALFAPDALRCVRGVLAVDPRHRRG
jgi:hypothetical protein